MVEMGVQKRNLTDWPDNLKDVIDWFLRVGGKDKGSNGDDKKSELQNAVAALTDYSKVKEGLGGGNVAGLFNAVGDGLQRFIGYDSGQRYMTDKGIGLSSYGGYASSYKDSAKWDGGSSNPTTYAHILLCSMPLLYFGITYLFWMCCRGWKAQMISGGYGGSNLNAFLQDMNYDTGKLKSDVNGQKIATLLGSEDDSIMDLKTIYSSVTYIYPQFLEQLQLKATTASPINVPLYKLYSASHTYLNNKTKSPIKDLPQTQADIANTLNGYSEAVTKLEPAGVKKLSEGYLTLLKQIQSVFNEDPPAPPSSSGGSIAGSLLGTAAVGGAGAAVAFNVGGVTTALKGAIGLFK
ncbi:variant erythrocyte surface antigen-1 family protein [Babesia caballi]|uniref:Variant erythrocyte surface antigen-1 family protein n=1 Tax=Babesia caballi TaxID=5871 RepID=A0AAV4LR67_BABCB|nr:variant erythrocyte surface antigen-1 family protein [Babesia caballi]